MTSKHIPYGESWTCTYGECCTDEACERRTWAVSVATVALIIGAIVVYGGYRLVEALV